MTALRLSFLLFAASLSSACSAAGGHGRGHACGKVSARRAAVAPKRPPTTRVRLWKITYRAHDGARRAAYVELPLRYGPGHNPPLPLVISPHARGVGGLANAALWRAFPTLGGFALVSPDGEGDRLKLDSWGAPGQIADLARMPQIVRKALPWLRINPRRVYAFGDSMGGQETLLLAARYPHLLAGAAAFDATTDLARQYRALDTRPTHGCARAERIGDAIVAAVQRELGGTPARDPDAYAARSPLTYARRLAFSRFPIQLWWGRADRLVEPAQQSAKLLRRIHRLNGSAAVEGFIGPWAHAASLRFRLRVALSQFSLAPRLSGGRYRRIGTLSLRKRRVQSVSSNRGA